MSRIQAPAAVEKHSIPPFSTAILKYSYSAVSPRSNPAKAAFITGIRKTAFGACFPPCSTRRCRKRSSKSRSFCALIISRFGMSPPNAAYAVRRTAVFRPLPQTILLRSSVRRKSKPFFKRSNGTKAFRKYLSEETAKFGCTVTALPSTSPANASYSLEKLAAEWGSAIRTVLVI